MDVSSDTNAKYRLDEVLESMRAMPRVAEDHLDQLLHTVDIVGKLLNDSVKQLVLLLKPSINNECEEKR